MTSYSKPRNINYIKFDEEMLIGQLFGRQWNSSKNYIVTHNTALCIILGLDDLNVGGCSFVSKRTGLLLKLHPFGKSTCGRGYFNTLI